MAKLPYRSRRWWRRAKDAIAQYMATKDAPVMTQRGGPPPDNTFFQTMVSSVTGDLKYPFAEHPAVFAVVTAVVEPITSVSLALKTGKEDAATSVLAGPWYDLLNKPAPRMDQATLWRLTAMHYLLGSAFWVLRSKKGKLSRPTELPKYIEVLPGSLFDPLVMGGELVGYDLRRPTTGEAERLAEWEVVPFMLPDPYRRWMSLPPIEAARRSIRTDVKAHEWNEATLENMAEPSGVLSTDKTLSDDQVQRMRRAMTDRHAGYGNARKLMILEGGLDYTQTGLSPRDMEFESQRQWSLQEIAMVYRVPKLVLGITDEIHSKESARVTMKFFWENAVIPHLCQFERTLETHLFAGRGAGRNEAAIAANDVAVWGEFDTSGIRVLQEDENERRELAARDWAMGVPFNVVNERHNLGYEPQEGGDTGFIAMGLQPVEFAAEPLDFDEDEPDEDEPPEPPDELDEEDPEDDDDSIDDDGDSRGAPTGKPESRQTPRNDGAPCAISAPAIQTASRRAAAREILWEQYIRGIHGPGERKMKGAVVGWLRDIRRRVLRYVENGRSARMDSPLDVQMWLDEQAEKWRETLAKKTEPITAFIVDASFDRLEQLLGGGLSVVHPRHPRVIDFVKKHGARQVKQVGDTTIKHIRNALLDGLTEGETVTEIAARVRKVMNVRAHQALTIARTETGMASVGSRYVGMQVEGIENHEWLSAGDEVVRTEPYDHSIDGEKRAIGDQFSNGLLYPLDANGAPGNIINCRCDAIPT